MRAAVVADFTKPLEIQDWPVIRPSSSAYHVVNAAIDAVLSGEVPARPVLEF
jgi:hypothetical protein